MLKGNFLSDPPDPEPEVSPKWRGLAEILTELKEEVKERKDDEARHCLVVTHDDRTSNQIREVRLVLNFCQISSLA